MSDKLPEGLGDEARPRSWSSTRWSKRFPGVKGGLLRRRPDQVAAVNDVSLRSTRGETLALVGEWLWQVHRGQDPIMKLHDPSEGRILIDGHDIAPLGPRPHEAGAGARCRRSSRIRSPRSTRA
jgi:ABC-type oligopeptide transport system ATPase subunit